MAALGALLASLAALPGAHGQSGMGNHFSGPVEGDGAAPFWNPAAMSWSSGSRADLGVNLASIRAQYDNPENAGSSSTSVTAPQPFLGAISDLGTRRWRFGVSAGVPYVSGAGWDAEDPEGSVTRYYANRAYILNAIVTPALSYAINDRLSVGVGVDIAYSRIEADFDKDFAGNLNAALGQGYATGIFEAGDPRLSAPVELRSDGFGVGGVLGIAVDLDRVRLGGSVHTAVASRTSGTLRAEYPQELIDFVASAAPSAELPPIASDVNMVLGAPLTALLGASFDLGRDWRLFLDYAYGDNSSTTSVDVQMSRATTPDLMDTVLIKGSRDRHSVGTRLSHAFAGGRALAIGRVRYENDTIIEEATTPNNVDFHKLELGAGLRWRLTQNVDLSALFSHYIVFEDEVTVSLHRPTASTALDPYNHPAPLGRYSAGADTLTLALGLRY